MIRLLLSTLSILALYGLLSGFSLSWSGCQHKARKTAYKATKRGLSVGVDLDPTYAEPTVINGIPYQSRVFNIKMSINSV